MSETAQWIIGGIIGLVGILGLYVAAHADAPDWYWIGLAVFAVAVAIIFYMVRRACDRADAERGRRTMAGHHDHV